MKRYVKVELMSGLITIAIMILVVLFFCGLAVSEPFPKNIIINPPDEAFNHIDMASIKLEMMNA